MVGLGSIVVSAAPAFQRPPPPGPLHTYRTFAPWEQTHAAGGPLITRDEAERTALRSGLGTGTVVSSQLQTVAEASRFLGTRAAANNIGDDREVWLVLVHGPYRPQFWAPAAGERPVYDHYYAIIDATSGHSLGSGSPLNKTW